MTLRFLVGAAVLSAASSLLSTAVQAQTWTQLKVADFNNQGYFSGGLSHLPDGRLVLGIQGTAAVQGSFGSAASTPLNLGATTVDPSFVAVQDATSALVGRGSAGNSVHRFNPSAPGTALITPALATLQNYSAVFWRHPTSGRQGWLIGGTNDGGRHNVTFVSTDGSRVGALTEDISEYSGGIAVDAAGNLYASLAEDTFTPGVDAADDGKVLRFTVAQVDAAAAAVLAAAPVPLTEASASLVYQFTTSGYLAVDSWGRIYSAGYQTQNLHVYDPASNTTQNLTPRTTALPGASTPSTINYAPAVFKRSGVGYISWLAFDGGTALAGADVIYGYAPETSFDVTPPTVSFASAMNTVSELAGTVNVGITLSHRSVTALTIPLVVSGTSSSADRALPTSVIIPAGITSANLAIRVTADLVDEPLDSETCIVTLGTPTPAGRATVNGSANVFTLTITDINKPLPVSPTTFTYTPGTVGSGYSGTFFTDFSSDPSRVPTSFTATGLPTGLSINRTTGEITGRPTAAGRFANILITVRNNGGSFVMGPYVIDIADYDAAAQGSWVGHVSREGTVTGDFNAGLGARLDLTTARNASISGKLLCGAKLYTFTGLLDTTLNPSTATITIPRTGTTALTLAISLDASTQTLTGTLDNGAGPATVTGWRSYWSATNPPISREGRHNSALEDLTIVPGSTPALPEGASYASFTVASTGLVTTLGRSADGIVLTGTAPMGRGGEVLHYQSLYSGLGSFISHPTIAADAGHTVSGAGSWSRKAQLGSKTYATGWATPLTLTVDGGLYTAPSSTALIMNTATTVSPTPNAQLTFAGGGQELSTTSGNSTVRLFTPSGATTFATAPNVVSLTVIPSTGLITGSFKATLGATVSTVPFFAMVIPDPATSNTTDGQAVGNFLLTQTGGASIRSGYVTLGATVTVP